jgi:LAGLIDADG endonuclease
MSEKIHPWYITGFTNADGCFSIHVERLKTSQYGYRLKPIFTVTQHEKSKETLHDIQNYFQCGKFILQHKNCINYTVSSRVDLYNSIIPHFSRYPLQSQKHRQYRQWLNIVRPIQNKEH